MIESLIRQNNSAGRPTVLGLATGSTPVGLYRELIRLHKEAGLDFSRVITFNLDEYFPMPPDDPHSYHRWMHETFFDHVNIQPQNIHIPDGTLAAGRRRGLLPALRADDPPGRRHRPADPRHRPHRAHRLQRARLDAAQPHAAGDARPGHAPRRGRRLLRRGERARTRRSRWASAPSSRPARSSSWRSASTRRRSCTRPSRGRMTRGGRRAASCSSTPTRPFLLDEAAAGDLTPYRRPWEVGPVDWTPDADPPGGHLAQPEGQEGAAEAVRRRLPRARAVRTAARARPGRAAGAARLRRDDGDHLHAPGRARSRGRSWSSARTRTTT